MVADKTPGLERERAATAYVAQLFEKGEPDLFIANYNGDRGEFVNFYLLLRHDMYSSLVFEVDDYTRTTFPAESIVWLQKKGTNGIKITEATCDDEQAKREYEAVKAKLHSTSVQRCDILDGHKRLFVYGGS